MNSPKKARSGLGSGYLALNYLLLSLLASWGIEVQEEFTLPFRPVLTLYLATRILLFAALLAFILHSIFYLDRNFFRIEKTGVVLEKEPGRAVFYLERILSVTGWILVAFPLFIYFNGKFSRDSIVWSPARIEEMGYTEFDFGVRFKNHWAVLNMKGKESGPFPVLMVGNDEGSFWKGEKVRIGLQKGYFGIDWIARINRDDESFSKETLEKYPTALTPMETLIDVYIREKRWEEAIAVAQEYMKLDPRETNLIIRLADYLMENFKDALAVPLLESLLKNNPNFDVYQTLGIAYHNTGDNKRSAEILEIASALNSRDWKTYQVLGMAYYDMGDYSQSLKNFTRVLKIRPRYPMAVQTVADLNKKLGAKASR